MMKRFRRELFHEGLEALDEEADGGAVAVEFAGRDCRRSSRLVARRLS